MNVFDPLQRKMKGEKNTNVLRICIACILLRPLSEQHIFIELVFYIVFTRDWTTTMPVSYLELENFKSYAGRQKIGPFKSFTAGS